ncbi:Flp family type IVb pilin [Micromonospora sp. BQ11]|uniref:Flp family type IVb pilin n=1 Tax=Micromonospora sp. BQ11 TaxID=3452212 RepID=UPI003F8A3562
MLEFIHRIMAWQASRDRGASAVEYALILAAIIGGLVVAYLTIGNAVANQLRGACRSIAGAGANCG